MTLAIATTILYPSSSFVTWLDFHLVRAEIILIYMDDARQWSVFEDLCKGRPVVLLEGSKAAAEMTAESRLIRRQEDNLTHAIAFLLARGTTWLLHIDIDEILWENGNTCWETQAGIGCVTFTNHEAVPLRQGTQSPFHDCVWFKVNGRLPFMAYGNGKSAVRLTPGVAPHGPHEFVGYEGQGIKLPGDAAPILLHYPTPSFNDWVSKFQHYGNFSNYWFGDPEKPNFLKFMLQSRDLVCQASKTGNWEDAREFFQQMALNSETCKDGASRGDIRRFAPLGKTPAERHLQISGH